MPQPCTFCTNEASASSQLMLSNGAPVCGHPDCSRIRSLNYTLSREVSRPVPDPQVTGELVKAIKEVRERINARCARTIAARIEAAYRKIADGAQELKRELDSAAEWDPNDPGGRVTHGGPDRQRYV